MRILSLFPHVGLDILGQLFTSVDCSGAKCLGGMGFRGVDIETMQQARYSLVLLLFVLVGCLQTAFPCCKGSGNRESGAYVTRRKSKPSGRGLMYHNAHAQELSCA